MTNPEAAIGTEIAQETPDGSAGPLLEAFNKLGLTLSPISEVPVLGAPLTAAAFSTPGDPTAAPTMAVAVATDGDLGPFDQAVVAIQATYPELAPLEATSVSSAEEVLATLPEPRELFALVRGGQPVGILARHADRRHGGVGPDLATATPTPVADAARSTGSAAASFGLLQDIVLDVSVELGRSSMPLSRLMNLGIGSIVELDRPAGAPVDVRVNGMLFARGEVVALDDEYAVRILEILSSPGS